MNSKNSGAYFLDAFSGTLRDILFFPIWWYSFGVVDVIMKLSVFVGQRQQSLGLFVWMKNIFVPMYGQRDIQGFIISVIIRIVQIIFRSIIMLFWLFFAFLLFSIWITLPILITYQMVWQIFLDK